MNKKKSAATQTVPKLADQTEKQVGPLGRYVELCDVPDAKEISNLKL